MKIVWGKHTIEEATWELGEDMKGQVSTPILSYKWLKFGPEFIKVGRM